MTAVSVRGLTKRYGEIEAVRGIDLEVATGEIFGFLGPNGAGKSTTIKILCTLAMPTSGEAHVAGFDCVRERDQVRRHIGLVFQDTTLDDYLSAEQNLRFHAVLYGMLEIARGLMHSPRVLFVDEPTVGLDPQTRVSMWSYIRELRQREKITIFLTTHYVQCFFSAGSIVWDREFGFMREMLVAPVRRSAIVVGKALGGATAGMTQGLIVLAIGPLVGIPYSPLLMLELIGLLIILSFAVTSIGVLVAVRIKSFQAFMALVQIIIMPMFFLSSALFPMGSLPTWLQIATHADPLTYAVDPMRKAVLADLGIHGFPGIDMPIVFELAIIAGTGLVALAVAAREFGKIE